jgi:hypothetical protein
MCDAIDYAVGVVLG